MALPLIDWDELGVFLELLGRSALDENLVFAIYPPDPDRPCLHEVKRPRWLPSRDLELAWNTRFLAGYSLGLVINPSLPRPEDWGSRPEERSRSGRRKAWGARNSHISHPAACWLEADGGLPLEEQLALPSRLDFPPPSFQVVTGGKSVHHYWLLDQNEERRVSPEVFRQLQRGLVVAAWAIDPNAGWDSSLGNPARVMRVPGGAHPKTGGRTVIHQPSVTGTIYDGLELLARLPDERLTPDSRKRRGKGGDGDPMGTGWFTTLDADERRAFTLEFLKVIPQRQMPSSMGGPPGTRAPAIKVLAGLIHYFGHDTALALIEEAGWMGQWWDPHREADSIPANGSGREFGRAGIGSVIRAARAAGWVHPVEVRQQRIERMALDSIRAGKNSILGRSMLSRLASSHAPPPPPTATTATTDAPTPAQP
ncbi:MAG: hypothetical protein VKK62_11705 [Synechococcaceae cyanobacterium]|nr:hypothetical protein [Synechococcaceae cyanobacterium]